MSKSDKVGIGSSGQDAWQEEYDAAYKAAFSEAYERSYRQGQLQERERGAQIFLSPEAIGEGRFEAAQVMFFNSKLSAEVIVAILAATDRALPKLAIERAWNAARSAGAAEGSTDFQLGRQTARSAH
jgi:hypothetical protein